MRGHAFNYCLIASPLRGEVGAQRRVRVAMLRIVGMFRHRTPHSTLSPEGRGSRGPAPSHNQSYPSYPHTLRLPHNPPIFRDTSGAAATGVRKVPNERRRCLFSGSRTGRAMASDHGARLPGLFQKSATPRWLSSHYFIPLRGDRRLGVRSSFGNRAQAAHSHAGTDCIGIACC